MTDTWAADTAQVFKEFGQAIGAALRPALDKSLTAMYQIYDVMYEQYRAAGTIYGDSHEGFMRWLNEIGQVQRLRQEAEAIHEHHAMLASVRQMVERQRRQ